MRALLAARWQKADPGRWSGPRTALDDRERASQAARKLAPNERHTVLDKSTGKFIKAASLPSLAVSKTLGDAVSCLSWVADPFGRRVDRGTRVEGRLEVAELSFNRAAPPLSLANTGEALSRSAGRALAGHRPARRMPKPMHAYALVRKRERRPEDAVGCLEASCPGGGAR